MPKKSHFTEKNAARMGAKGGKQRAKTLTAARRSEIARAGGLARHGKPAPPIDRKPTD